ncbi:2OG-Fe(II) oxygenase family protein [Sphingomonas sp. CCH9-F2]|uniref:2OG-Fe(II) oxygenase family protein n=1 Tax=Sphingomonas sp. CCH9-F2 TaxID=1768778 RepID=UPI000837784D|nr:2OG-Fe(II) oxygenase family protein [Sphingomonas sp. CCH9-F2]
MVAAAPDDQAAIALLATAWRLAGDPRHAPLCEDPALVTAQRISTPAGWADLPAFLADLAAALEALHGWQAHPLEQSIRHGSQTQVDLSRLDVPVVRALFAALDAPIRAHIAGLGSGDDPVRRRAAGGYRFAGAWSVRLRAGGFHKDHVHPAGWLSSAFYVALPDAVERAPQGWLALGRPGVPTRPVLAPFRHIRPEPGMVALFPSYLWHGTEPFTGDAPRLTVAFDVVPG